MLSVHLFDLSIIMPFSVENESLGKPYTFHDIILTGSPNVSIVFEFSDTGIWNSFILSYHIFSILFLYWETNAPPYDNKPAPIKQSPVNFVYCFAKNSIDADHLIFSPLKLSVNIAARSNLSSHNSISFNNASFLA